MGLTIAEVSEVVEILDRACGGDAPVDPDGVLRVGHPNAELSVQDRLALDALGWHPSAEDGRWCKVVG